MDDPGDLIQKYQALKEENESLYREVERIQDETETKLSDNNNNNNKSIYIAPILSSAKRFTMWLKSKSLKIITYICT